VTGNETWVFQYNPETIYKAAVEESKVSKTKESVNVKIECQNQADLLVCYQNTYPL
jgi:hypothetical protein